jgi:hypothetical protein
MKRQIIFTFLIALLLVSFVAPFIPQAKAVNSASYLYASCITDDIVETLVVTVTYLNSTYVVVDTLTTPDIVLMDMSDYTQHYLNASATDTGGHVFAYWDVAGTRYYENYFPIDLYTQPASIIAVYEGVGTPTPDTGLYNATFVGVINERTGTQIMSDEVYIKAVFDNGLPNSIFKVNGTRTFYFNSTPAYFQTFNGTQGTLLGVMSDKQFWVESLNTGRTFYFMNVTYGNYLSYTIQFDDQAGALSTHPYVTVSTLLNGTYIPTQRLKVDSENKVVVSVLYGSRYQITVGNGAEYTFGDIVFADQTNRVVQLTLTKITFPPEDITTHISMTADRNNDTITFFYQNLDYDTVLVTLNVRYVANKTIATSDTSVLNSWAYTSPSLDNETDYYVEAIAQTSYGNVRYSHLLLASMEVTNPFDISFLGTAPFSTAQIIPWLMIILISALFSAKNLSVGAFTVISMITVFRLLGWLTIGYDAIVLIWVLVIVFVLVRMRGKEE